MTEMREWWANVYLSMFDMDRTLVGDGYPDRDGSIGRAASASTRPICRIHVRLKPEGAPKRYASRDNQRAWEANTEGCTRMVLLGFPGEALV